MFSSSSKQALNTPKPIWGTPLTDLVNSPGHYTKGIETNEYIKSWSMSYAQGNVIKYVSRHLHKHQDKNLQLQDLKKAKWYLEDMIKDLEALPPISNP